MTTNNNLDALSQDDPRQGPRSTSDKGKLRWEPVPGGSQEGDAGHQRPHGRQRLNRPLAHLRFTGPRKAPNSPELADNTSDLPL